MTKTDYGFSWGPVEVERAAHFAGNRKAKKPGHYVLSVKTETQSIDIYVSEGGRSIRVFKEGKELKA
jgi:hypothetical protein